MLVDSPLLSYIDVRHMNFPPPKFRVGKARDLWSDGFEMHLQSWNGIRGVGEGLESRVHWEVGSMWVRERGGLLISDEFGHPPRYGAPTPYLYWARVTTLYSSSFSMITIKTLDFSFLASRNVGYTPKSYNDFTIFLNDHIILLKRKFNGRL